jgi:hypothetical protein
MAHIRSRQTMLVSMLFGGRIYTAKNIPTLMRGPEVKV